LIDRSGCLGKDALIRVDEFIYPVDFVVTETEKMANAISQIPVI